MVDTSTEAVTKLLDGVTPGPWGAEYDDYGEEIWFGGEGCGTWTVGPCFIGGDGHDPDLARIMDADARFIAAARDLIPALLAERDEARAEVERLKAKPAQAGSQFVTQLHHEHFDAFAKAVDRVECQPVDHVTVHDPALHVAFSLWKAEAERAAPNVARNRTPEMFSGELESTRAKWLSLADAALRAIAEGKA